MRYIVALMVVSLVGCESSKIEQNPTPKIPANLPALFELGDEVVPQGSSKVGIIINKSRKVSFNKGFWTYTVMYQNDNMYFDEDELRLARKYDWKLFPSVEFPEIPKNAEFPDVLKHEVFPSELPGDQK